MQHGFRPAVAGVRELECRAEITKAGVALRRPIDVPGRIDHQLTVRPGITASVFLLRSWYFRFSNLPQSDLCAEVISVLRVIRERSVF